MARSAMALLERLRHQVVHETARWPEQDAAAEETRRELDMLRAELATARARVKAVQDDIDVVRALADRREAAPGKVA